MIKICYDPNQGNYLPVGDAPFSLKGVQLASSSESEKLMSSNFADSSSSSSKSFSCWFQRLEQFSLAFRCDGSRFGRSAVTEKSLKFWN